MRDFTKKVAVITGGGSGLGRSLAIKLAAAGAQLALVDLDILGLEETKELLDTKQTVTLHVADVADLKAMTPLRDAVLQAHTRVDLLINNAGITLTPTVFDEIPDDLFRRVVDVNMWGVYIGTRLFLPDLKLRPEAAIVNISSLAGLVGLYGYAPYVMSKFAVRGLTETLQTELVKTGVEVLTVHPGGIQTDLIKHAPDLTDPESRNAAHDAFRRVARLNPDDAAEKILRAVQRKKRRIILGADAKIVNAVRVVFPDRFPDILHAVFSQGNFGRPKTD